MLDGESINIDEMLAQWEAYEQIELENRRKYLESKKSSGNKDLEKYVK